MILRFFFIRSMYRMGIFIFGLLKFHNFIGGGGGGGMPDILDILFSVNSRCRVHTYV